jgi:hypothetical protein
MKIASKQRGPALVRSSEGMAKKHWQPQTHRCDKSGFFEDKASKGVMFGARVDVGSQLQRY